MRPGRRLLERAEQRLARAPPSPAAWSERDEVGAVVDRDLRLAGDERRDVARRRRRRPRRGRRGPPPRSARRARRRCRPASRAGSRRTARSGAAGHQRAHEVRRLGRHVQARGDAHAVERALGVEALADRAQDGHLPVGPLDAGGAGVGEARGRRRGWPSAGSLARGAAAARTSATMSSTISSSSRPPRASERQVSKATAWETAAATRTRRCPRSGRPLSSTPAIAVSSSCIGAPAGASVATYGSSRSTLATIGSPSR